MIFKREPSFWLGFIRAVIALMIALRLIHLNEAQTGAVLAVVSAVLAIGVALSVRPFKWPLVTGLVQVVLVLLLAFGFSISQEVQGGVMAVVGFIIAFFDRSLVTPEASLPATEPRPAVATNSGVLRT